jgi:GTP-binding protein EngB required for normal cell division
MALIQPAVQQQLALERLLLADIQAFLTARGAPFDALSHIQTALSGLDETFLLVVVGEFNAGKSSFLNALLEQPLLLEGVTPTTDRIYVLVKGNEHGQEQGQEHGQTLGQVLGKQYPTDDPYVVRLEVNLPLLENLALVDTPGTNAVIRRHQSLTEGFLPRADLLLFLTSADRPFSESERQFLELARRWGKNVMMIINKADLLENDSSRLEVKNFVETHARGVLGLTPPVYLLSARNQVRNAQKGGDPGFQQFREALQSRLGERERVRLKLENPLHIARQLLGGEHERIAQARQVLSEDLKLLANLEGQQKLHTSDMDGELARQLLKIDEHLQHFSQRAITFIDEKMRFSKLLELLKSKALEQEFQRQAVGDLPIRLEETLGATVDRFVERNLQFWEDVQRFLKGRQETDLAQTRFQYDRNSLIANISQKAEQHVSSSAREDYAKGFVSGVQGALLTSSLTAAGGVGLGALTVALVSSTALDITGITAGLVITGVGALVLPMRRARAIRQIRERIVQTQETLHTLIRREYAGEQDKADARLRDTLAPFTRFISLERDKLEQAELQTKALLARVEQVGQEVGRRLG